MSCTGPPRQSFRPPGPHRSTRTTGHRWCSHRHPLDTDSDHRLSRSATGERHPEWEAGVGLTDRRRGGRNPSVEPVVLSSDLTVASPGRRDRADRRPAGWSGTTLPEPTVPPAGVGTPSTIEGAMCAIRFLPRESSVRTAPFRPAVPVPAGPAPLPPRVGSGPVRRWSKYGASLDHPADRTRAEPVDRRVLDRGGRSRPPRA